MTSSAMRLRTASSVVPGAGLGARCGDDFADFLFGGFGNHLGK